LEEDYQISIQNYIENCKSKVLSLNLQVCQIKNREKMLLKVLEKLKERKDIQIVSTDKNLGTAILNYDTYKSLCCNILTINLLTH
jgi:hypothetical protein